MYLTLKYFFLHNHYTITFSLVFSVFIGLRVWSGQIFRIYVGPVIKYLLEQFLKKKTPEQHH